MQPLSHTPTWYKGYLFNMVLYGGEVKAHWYFYYEPFATLDNKVDSNSSTIWWHVYENDPFHA